MIATVKALEELIKAIEHDFDLDDPRISGLYDKLTQELEILFQYVED